jgi:hypothetical protein
LSLIPILAPSILIPAHVKELRGALLGLPPWPIQKKTKAYSMAEGTLWFIQYDYLLTSCAMLVWSVSLKLASTASADHQSVSQATLRYVSAIFRAAALGPMGSAASLVWERDEVLLGATTVSSDTIEVRKSQ